ncbi:hypothetical protein C8R47DRAFT_1303112 [Mycena vitilis]|nr:hypothetical protein C8R47DRAFT_1303112 [Mycena vitilis]
MRGSEGAKGMRRRVYRGWRKTKDKHRPAPPPPRCSPCSQSARPQRPRRALRAEEGQVEAELAREGRLRGASRRRVQQQIGERMGTRRGGVCDGGDACTGGRRSSEEMTGAPQLEDRPLAQHLEKEQAAGCWTKLTKTTGKGVAATYLKEVAVVGREDREDGEDVTGRQAMSASARGELHNVCIMQLCRGPILRWCCTMGLADRFKSSRCVSATRGTVTVLKHERELGLGLKNTAAGRTAISDILAVCVERGFLRTVANEKPLRVANHPFAPEFGRGRWRDGGLVVRTRAWLGASSSWNATFLRRETRTHGDASYMEPMDCLRTCPPPSIFRIISDNWNSKPRRTSWKESKPVKLIPDCGREREREWKLAMKIREFSAMKPLLLLVPRRSRSAHRTAHAQHAFRLARKRHTQRAPLTALGRSPLARRSVSASSTEPDDEREPKVSEDGAHPSICIWSSDGGEGDADAEVVTDSTGRIRDGRRRNPGSGSGSRVGVIVRRCMRLKVASVGTAAGAGGGEAVGQGAICFPSMDGVVEPPRAAYGRSELTEPSLGRNVLETAWWVRAARARPGSGEAGGLSGLRRHPGPKNCTSGADSQAPCTRGYAAKVGGGGIAVDVWPKATVVVIVAFSFLRGADRRAVSCSCWPERTRFTQRSAAVVSSFLHFDEEERTGRTEFVGPPTKNTSEARSWAPRKWGSEIQATYQSMDVCCTVNCRRVPLLGVGVVVFAPVCAGQAPGRGKLGDRERDWLHALSQRIKFGCMRGLTAEGIRRGFGDTAHLRRVAPQQSASTLAVVSSPSSTLPRRTHPLHTHPLLTLLAFFRSLKPGVPRMAHRRRRRVDPYIAAREQIVGRLPFAALAALRNPYDDAAGDCYVLRCVPRAVQEAYDAKKITRGQYRAATQVKAGHSKNFDARQRGYRKCEIDWVLIWEVKVWTPNRKLLEALIHESLRERGATVAPVKCSCLTCHREFYDLKKAGGVRGVKNLARFWMKALGQAKRVWVSLRARNVKK